jgi:dihydrolipoamide dehydrogenase
MSKKIKTEVVVLGSGPGGYTAAFRAADLGKQVVLLERYQNIGGVCLNVGCIPSKALLHGANIINEAKEISKHGINFNDPKIDIEKLRSWKNDVVRKLTSGLANLAKRRKVEIVYGIGKFISANEIEIQNSNEQVLITFDNAIIAAGSKPIKLPFMPEDPRIMDSTDALNLLNVPNKMLIIGGGIIGLEMATIYAALGSKISIVEFLDQLIPGADSDLVKPLHRFISNKYEKIMLSTKVVKVEADANGLLAHFESKITPIEPQQYDSILVAVGRQPNGKTIGAENAGINVDQRGFISVDKQMRANVPHIYAIGDIVGNPMLAHKAVVEGRLAAEVIAGKDHHFTAKCIPSVAYTNPEIAWVGLTETEAKKQNINYDKGTFPWLASGRSLSIDRTEGITKLLFDEKTQQLLGAGIVGPNAGELIAELALAIEMDCKASDIAETIHPHPTLSETIMMSAEAFLGTITDLYMPKQHS